MRCMLSQMGCSHPNLQSQCRSGYGQSLRRNCGTHGHRKVDTRHPNMANRPEKHQFELSSLEPSVSKSLGRRDKDKFSCELLRQEVLLRLHDVLQRVGSCYDGAYFTAFDVANEVLEDGILLKSATKETEVLQIERPDIELDDWTGDCTGHGIPTARLAAKPRAAPAIAAQPPNR